MVGGAPSIIKDCVVMARVKTASGTIYNQTVLAHITDHVSAAELNSVKAGERIVVDWWQQAVKRPSCVLADKWGQTGLDGYRTLIYIHTTKLRGPVIALTAAWGVGSTTQGAIVAGKTVTNETIDTDTSNSGVFCGTASMLMARLTVGDL